MSRSTARIKSCDNDAYIDHMIDFVSNIGEQGGLLKLSCHVHDEED